MMLTSKTIKGEEAHALGLVDAIVLLDELIKTAKRNNLGSRVGLRKEAKASRMLSQSDTSKSLVHVFFAQRATSKIPSITDRGMMPRQVNKVAVVGGGLMGIRIATTLILNYFPVIVKEVNENILQAGINRVKVNLKSQMVKGTIPLEKFEKMVIARTMTIRGRILST
ncbi:hypothetical protein CDL15_Pgr016324 [Punica granatum]|uniref:3-hydroxyacyl-CoA dehydrogenase NAD binding domain-containing protein n=1 Tax=Punica granatum TaxID=22663 RepID=A0A218W5G0_PUNGR|nr:hypothetical protein CDL15_Pgr016324 [Punica granatum]